MTLPIDQTQLYEDLCQKLDQQQTEDQLIRFMGGVLGSLLRRRGDADFLRTVQDAFTERLGERDWPGQKELAREVIGTVIAKRPEVALAWQRVSGEEPHPLARRAVDVDAAAAAAADDLPEISLTVEAEDPFDAFRHAVVVDLGGALARRLALFTVPPERFPSPAYMHEQPFFLINDSFARVVSDFLEQVLVPCWADSLRTIFAQAGTNDAAAALAACRAEIWHLVTTRLELLAAQSARAREKLAAAREAAATESDFQLVEVPVSRKRTLSVLGVQFSLGTATEMTMRKVRVPGAAKPTSEEMLALDLVTKLHDMAADAGFEMPDAGDLVLLRDLLAFDAERLARDMPGLRALVADRTAEPAAALAAIEAAVAGHPAAIADAVVVTLFSYGMDGAFGFEEMVALAKRWDADAHPFLAAEIIRRPRDMAFQIRDALRRRLDRNNTGMTVVMLFEVWKVLADSPFQTALSAALTVFSAFPIAFAGDPAEEVFGEIGNVLTQAVTAEVLDSAATIEAVMRLYSAVVPSTSGL